jgi:outer membrane protein assembly factor BamB
MRKRSQLHVSVATLVVLLTAAGCGGPFDPTTPSAVGSLVVSFQAGEARTVTPATDTTVAEYSISGVGPAGTSFAATVAAPQSSYTAPDLLVGPWEVTVTASNAGGTLLYAGSAVGTVAASTQSPLSVTLRPVDGTGELSISVQWQDFLATSPDVTGTIAPQTGGATPSPISFTVDAPAASASYVGSLEAGYYTLSFELLDGTDPVWQSPTEAVRILAGQTTELSVTVTYDDITVAPTSIPGQEIWRFTAGDAFDASIWSSPALGPDGTVYVGSDNGLLYALNPDGSARWSYDTGDRVYSSPAVADDGTIYVGSYDNNVHAVNPDGTSAWASPFSTGDWVRSSPAIGADGIIYVGSRDGNLYAINPDGTPAWASPFSTAGAIASSPAVAADGTIYVGSYDSNLYAVNPDGSLKWSFQTADWVHSSPAIGADGTVYVGSYDDYLYAIDPVTGMEDWSYYAGDWIASSPAIGPNGEVYVGDRAGVLHAVDGATGDGLWSFPAGVGGIYSSPLVGADGAIYFGSYDRTVYALNADGSLQWSFATGNGGVYSSPVVAASGAMYVGARDGNLYALGSASEGAAPTSWPMFGNTPDRTARF